MPGSCWQSDSEDENGLGRTLWDTLDGDSNTSQ